MRLSSRMRTECLRGVSISLLDNLDTDVTDAQNRLTQAREKMQKLMKTNSSFYCKEYT